LTLKGDQDIIKIKINFHLNQFKFMPKIRVRIAPSPTGFVHIGNLRTILYNYLFARHNNGDFIVRIEDTDRSRFVKGAIENLLNVLNWTKIEYDEGPFYKKNSLKEAGEYGPYFQSKRLEIYNEHIKHLINADKAYYCFCSKERLDNLREEQKKQNLPPKYDGFCRSLSREQVQEKLRNNEPKVVRFKMPEDKEIIINDLVFGAITVNTKDLDDYVLIKSDNFPTYHFANVIDDHLMKITHVMRGNEWIASTPKHVLLYDSFGWKAPIFAHLPQIVNKQKKKLSKRDAAASVKDYIQSGYLPDALINFIALLGWNPGSDQEIFTRNELIKQFDLERVHKSAAVFDTEKLNWLNSYYIRQLSLDEFFEKAAPFLERAELILKTNNKYKILNSNEKITTGRLKQIIALEQQRINKLDELPEALEYFFKNELDYTEKILIWKNTSKDKIQKNLKALQKFLQSIDEKDFIKEKLEKAIKNFIQDNSLENGEVLWPMRVALSGRKASPGPFEIASAMGKEKTLLRLDQSIQKL